MNTLKNIKKPEDCKSRCDNSGACVAFTWIQEDHSCQIKSSIGSNLIFERKRISGFNTKVIQQMLHAISKLLQRYSEYLKICVEELVPYFKDVSVIVSLTTIPSRLNEHIFNTLESIAVDQVFLPTKVVLSIPKYSTRFNIEYPNVPENIKQIGQNDLISILTSDKDYGAATKLIPAIRDYASNSNDVIITVDDDNTYMPWVVGNLLQNSMKKPNAIIAHVGYTLKKNSGVIKHPNFNYYSWPNRVVKVDCIGGFGGVLYKKKFFGDFTLLSEGLFNEYPEGRYVDDDYISGVASYFKVEKFAVPGSDETIYQMEASQSTSENALSSGANKNKNIDRQSAILTRFVNNKIM